MGVLTCLVIIILLPGKRASAQIQSDYFKGATIYSNISCFDVVSDSNLGLKYDKISLREDSEYLTVEWLDVSGLGTNRIEIKAFCNNDDGGNFETTLTQTYAGETFSRPPIFVFAASDTNLGLHKFIVKATINGKTISKTLIVNIVRTVPGVGEIRYRTSGLIPREISNLSGSYFKMTFNDSPILPVENLTLTASGRTTLNSLVPQEFKKGQECLILGIGVITVYNIRTNAILGVYRLDTEYNKLITDFNWLSGSLQDFISKKNIYLSYRNKISTKFTAEYLDYGSGSKLRNTYSTNVEYFSHQVAPFSHELPPYDVQNHWIFGASEYEFLFKLTETDAMTPSFGTRDSTYLTLGSLGIYDEYFDKRLGGNSSAKVSYIFQRQMQSPSPTPTPTPKPSTGNVYVNCVSKSSMNIISSSYYSNIPANTRQIYNAPSVPGFALYQSDMPSVEVSVSAGETLYISFYYVKIGSLKIEHREKNTNSLLDSQTFGDICLLGDVELQADCKLPGQIGGYVPVRFVDGSGPLWESVILNEYQSDKLIIFYYVKAECTLKYVLNDAKKAFTAKTEKIYLPKTVVISNKVDDKGLPDSDGMFKFSGTDYGSFNSENKLDLSEWDSNITITLFYSYEDSNSDISITGAYNHWGKGTDRYMGLERLTISCINLNANSMVVRFSPQLEAMKYTSPAGITYDYFDFFKKHVYFPADSTVSFTSGKAIWKYSLPLANETLSWKNVRKRPKYYVDVIINRDGYSELRKYYIDITGNVTDIIKPQ